MTTPITYRDLPFVARAVRIGGKGKQQLLLELDQARIALNEAGRALFAHDGFTTGESASILATIEMTVGDLGFPQGATIENIVERAAQLGLSLCPLELGPHLRLHYLDQPEGELGFPPSQNRAPPGSLTIISEHNAAPDFPTGFYLRRIRGVLWLRGYRSGPDHVWSPDDAVVFADSSRQHLPGVRPCPAYSRWIETRSARIALNEGRDARRPHRSTTKIQRGRHPRPSTGKARVEGWGPSTKRRAKPGNIILAKQGYKAALRATSHAGSRPSTRLLRARPRMTGRFLFAVMAAFGPSRLCSTPDDGRYRNTSIGCLC